MSGQEKLSLTHSADDRAEPTGSENAPQRTEAQAASDEASEAAPNGPSRELTLLTLAAAHPRAERLDPPQVSRSGGLVGSRFALAGAALGVVVVVAGALVWEHRQQAYFLAERASETQSLTQAVESLKVRLDAIDSARSSNDLADLIGDMKSAVVSAREFNGAVAQLSQRVDKLDHEEGAKVDKLSDRVDHEASVLTAEFSARFDKLDKTGVAPVSALAQAASPPQPPVQPKFNANVSMETTGSIDRPKPLLRSYIVLAARDDVALVGGRFGEREVRQGDILPGAGRVERIQRNGAGWIVVTSEGLIPSSDLPPY
jgi:hypothetical protein